MEIIKNSAYFIIIGSGLLWLIMFIIMAYYRFAEERIYKDWKNKSEKVKSQTIEMPFIKGQLKILQEKFQPKIDDLNRKKQFLKDIMPFIKK